MSQPPAVTCQALHLGVDDVSPPPAASSATYFSLREPEVASSVVQDRHDYSPFHGPMEFAICDCLVKKKKGALKSLH